MTGAERFKEIGMEEGMQKGLEDVAIKLLQEGVDCALITKVTDLSIEKIKKLKSVK